MTRMGRSKIGFRWTEQPLKEEIGRLSLYICFKRPGEIVQKSISALIFTVPARLNINPWKKQPELRIWKFASKIPSFLLDSSVMSLAIPSPSAASPIGENYGREASREGCDGLGAVPQVVDPNHLPGDTTLFQSSALILPENPLDPLESSPSQFQS